MRRMLALCEAEDILKPQAAYGYWKAAGQGNDLIIFEQDGSTEVARFTLPRQPKEDGECIADFFRDVDDAGARRDRRCRWSPSARKRPISRGAGSRTTATRTTCTCTACRWRWPRRWPNTCTSASAPSSASPARTTATWRRCCRRAIAAPLFVRLSGLPAAGGPGADPVAAGRRADRRFAVRRVPAASGAVDQRDRGAQPAREVFLRVDQLRGTRATPDNASIAEPRIRLPRMALQHPTR